MISGSNFSSEQEDFFSNPESLEQLRDNLMTLFHQQQNNFTCVIDGLHHMSIPLQKQSFKQINPKQMCQYIKELEEQFQQRSKNISTLVNLSTKMIDFIIEERYRTITLMERYEAQIDECRMNIDYLTNTKNVIQNDVDFFREQLQAARNQLQNIIEEKQEMHQDQYISGDDRQYEIRRELQKDRKIQILQVELENIKQELKLYKFESHRHKSHIKCNDGHQLSGCSSPKHSFSNLKQKRKSQIVGQADKKNYLDGQKHLEEENQRLQEQIKLLKQKTVHQFKLNCNQDIVESYNCVKQPFIDCNHQIGDYSPTVNQISQDRSIQILSIVESTQNLPAKFIIPNVNIIQLLNFENCTKQYNSDVVNLNEGRQQGTSWLSKNTSLTLIKKQSYKLFQQSRQLISYASPGEIKQQDVELELNNSTNKFHYLSSEWSAKSFQYNISNPIDLLQQNQAIYLIDDNHSETSIKTPMDIYQYINTEETKNTDSSIKGLSTYAYLQGMTTKRSRKDYEGMEVTQRTQKKVNSSTAKNFQKKKKTEEQSQKVKKASLNFFDVVFNYVVGNRVRKHCKL